MNFLFHRHLAVRDLDSQAAGLGAMLPDLWRMADRRMRARKSASADSVAEAGDPAESGSSVPLEKASMEDVLFHDLARGVEHHLKVDHWFHQHPAFLDGEAETRALFTDGTIRADRMGLLSHVAWELCLDGALLRREGVEPTLAQAREIVEVCRGEPLRRLRRLHRPPFAGDDRRVKSFDTRLEKLLDQLAYGTWIEGYAVGLGLVDRLSGVRRRVGLTAFDEADRERLAEKAEQLISKASTVLHQLEDVRSSDLHDHGRRNDS